MDLIDDSTYEVRFWNDRAGVVKKFDKINSDYITRTISKYEYDPVFLVKDEAVESAKIPPFITAFYLFIFYRNTIPSPEELWDFYFNKYFTYDIPDEEKDTCSLKSPKMRVKFCGSKVFNCFALKSRLFRAYPSLIRDFHFYYLCKESNLFQKVTYSLNADYFDGQDLILGYENEKFVVSMFIGTSRGDYYKLKKNNRHDYSDCKEILLSIDRDDCNKVGDFFLYKEEHVYEIIAKIDRFLKSPRELPF